VPSLSPANLGNSSYSWREEREWVGIPGLLVLCYWEKLKGEKRRVPLNICWWKGEGYFKERREKRGKTGWGPQSSHRCQRVSGEEKRGHQSRRRKGRKKKGKEKASPFRRKSSFTTGRGRDLRKGGGGAATIPNPRRGFKGTREEAARCSGGL